MESCRQGASRRDAVGRPKRSTLAGWLQREVEREPRAMQAGSELSERLGAGRPLDGTRLEAYSKAYMRGGPR